MSESGAAFTGPPVEPPPPFTTNGGGLLTHGRFHARNPATPTITSAPTTTANDPYDFGTQFSFSLEGGVRINPTNSWEIRLNAKPTFYQNHYPTQYYATPTGGTPLLDKSTARSGFRHGIDYTAGLSFPLFR